MVAIRYSLCGAGEARVRLHPQQDVEQLGMRVLKWLPDPEFDCIYMEVDSLPFKLPDYINEVSDILFREPTEAINIKQGNAADWASTMLYLGNKKIEEGIKPLMYK